MEKRRAFIINTVSVLLVCGIVYLFFKYAIFVVMPVSCRIRGGGAR